jgi:hypothetical protein
MTQSHRPSPHNVTPTSERRNVAILIRLRVQKYHEYEMMSNILTTARTRQILLLSRPLQYKIKLGECLIQRRTTRCPVVTKKVKIKIYQTTIQFLFIRVWNLVSHSNDIHRMTVLETGYCRCWVTDGWTDRKMEKTVWQGDYFRTLPFNIYC